MTLGEATFAANHYLRQMTTTDKILTGQECRPVLSRLSLTTTQKLVWGCVLFARIQLYRYSEYHLVQLYSHAY
jgi:hypothetical protein